MAEAQGGDVPQTLEGWYLLHDIYTVDWPRWRALDPAKRSELIAEASAWAAAASEVEKGDSAFYSVLTQKGDLMFVFYRDTPEQLNREELALRQIGLYDYLIPSYSYFSVIEVSLHELTAIVRKKLMDNGVKHGSPEFDAAFAAEMEGQKERVKSRLFRDVPDHKFICFYPMNKKRGEQVNWYTLSAEERRGMMRNHGRIGHKYHETVTQIIAGSVGLDDWEWGVSLHANDALVFKKLIYEMRFDPASALYAEFGPFYIGIKRTPEQLPALLEGKLD
jgi:chlorite dismutase